MSKNLCLKMTLTGIAIALSACSNNKKPINEPVKTPEQTLETPQVRRFPLNVPADKSLLTVNPGDSFSLKLTQYPVPEAVHFRFSCGDETCPENASVSDQGIFHWDGTKEFKQKKLHGIKVEAVSADNETLGFTWVRVLTENRNYQNGDHWNRTAFDEKSHSLPENLAGIGQAIVKISNSASGFYLGKYSGEHLVATNFHVYQSTQCRLLNVTFPILKIDARCKDTLMLDESLDLAIVSLKFEDITFGRVTEAQMDSQLHNRVQFDFAPTQEKGTPLALFGYGYFHNPFLNLTYESGGDCLLVNSVPKKVLAERRSGKKVETWSLFTGCDASPADSGAPIISLITGRAIGILWGGHEASDSSPSYSSQQLQESVANPMEEQSLPLTGMSPASLIFESLKNALATESDEKKKEILKALVEEKDSAAGVVAVTLP